MDLYEALRLRAIRAVQKPDEGAYLRYIHRWYSRTFHTPLHVVEELDPVDVLTAFYEQTYEDMEEADREREIGELLETPVERRERLIAKDIERAEAFEFAEYTAKEQLRQDQRKVADLKANESKRFLRQQVPETTMAKSTMPIAVKDLKEIPPDIEMRFVAESDFEAALEGPGTMVPGGKPQSSK